MKDKFGENISVVFNYFHRYITFLASFDMKRYAKLPVHSKRTNMTETQNL